IRAEFDVYANDLTVRTSHLDATHAFLNPPNLLPYVVGRAHEPLAVQVEHPDTWRLACGLPPGIDPLHRLLAQDYDELADSPIHAGPDPVYDFDVAGIPHAIATWGRGNLQPDRFTRDVARIVETEGALFGGLPYERYLFILLLSD